MLEPFQRAQINSHHKGTIMGVVAKKGRKGLSSINMWHCVNSPHSLICLQRVVFICLFHVSGLFVSSLEDSVKHIRRSLLPLFACGGSP